MSKSLKLNVTGVEARVCERIAARQQVGLVKYPTELALNPAKLAARIKHLQDELLDGALYCEWAMQAIEDKDQRIAELEELIQGLQTDVLLCKCEEV